MSENKGELPSDGKRASPNGTDRHNQEGSQLTTCNCPADYRNYVISGEHSNYTLDYSVDGYGYLCTIVDSSSDDENKASAPEDPTNVAASVNVPRESRETDSAQTPEELQSTEPEAKSAKEQQQNEEGEGSICPLDVPFVDEIGAAHLILPNWVNEIIDRTLNLNESVVVEEIFSFAEFLADENDDCIIPDWYQRLMTLDGIQYEPDPVDSSNHGDGTTSGVPEGTLAEDTPEINTAAPIVNDDNPPLDAQNAPSLCSDISTTSSDSVSFSSEFSDDESFDNAKASEEIPDGAASQADQSESEQHHTGADENTADKYQNGRAKIDTDIDNSNTTSSTSNSRTLSSSSSSFSLDLGMSGPNSINENPFHLFSSSSSNLEGNDPFDAHTTDSSLEPDGQDILKGEEKPTDGNSENAQLVVPGPNADTESEEITDLSSLSPVEDDVIVIPDSPSDFATEPMNADPRPGPSGYRREAKREKKSGKRMTSFPRRCGGKKNKPDTGRSSSDSISASSSSMSSSTSSGDASYANKSHLACPIPHWTGSANKIATTTHGSDSASACRIDPFNVRNKSSTSSSPPPLRLIDEEIDKRLREIKRDQEFIKASLLQSQASLQNRLRPRSPDYPPPPINENPWAELGNYPFDFPGLLPFVGPDNNAINNHNLDIFNPIHVNLEEPQAIPNMFDYVEPENPPMFPDGQPDVPNYNFMGNPYENPIPNVYNNPHGEPNANNNHAFDNQGGNVYENAEPNLFENDVNAAAGPPVENRPLISPQQDVDNLDGENDANGRVEVVECVVMLKAMIKYKRQ